VNTGQSSPQVVEKGSSPWANQAQCKWQGASRRCRFQHAALVCLTHNLGLHGPRFGCGLASAELAPYSWMEVGPVCTSPSARERDHALEVWGASPIRNALQTAFSQSSGEGAGRTDFPSMSTVQAPHWPGRSQSGPCSPGYRVRHTRAACWICIDDSRLAIYIELDLRHGELPFSTDCGEDVARFTN